MIHAKSDGREGGEDGSRILPQAKPECKPRLLRFLRPQLTGGAASVRSTFPGDCKFPHPGAAFRRRKQARHATNRALKLVRPPETLSSATSAQTTAESGVYTAGRTSCMEFSQFLDYTNEENALGASGGAGGEWADARQRLQTLEYSSMDVSRTVA